MYTAGALDVLLENDINFDGIIGTSAGAVFGVNFLSRQDGRVIRYNCRFNGDRNYMGIKPLLKSGDFFNTEYAYYKVPNELDIFDDEAYQKSGVPFYATVTDVKTGKPEYLKVESVLRDMEMLRASASMPFISKPVIIGGRAYLDGGISDSIPFEHFSEMGYKKQVVILTRDMNYRKKPMNKLLIRSFYSKFPGLCNALENRHNVYNESIDKLCELEQSGKVFIIRPSEPITISRTERNPDRLRSVYELGRKDMKMYLEGLEEFLEKEQEI
jgi:predicted esterase of the alpha-beta hydrolase superfamily